MKYTEKIHAEGLLIILSEPHPCGSCPSLEMRLNIKYKKSFRWDNGVGFKQPQCIVCWDFIGLKRNKDGWGVCPCYEGKGSEANKRTWLALEEKGDI